MKPASVLLFAILASVAISVSVSADPLPPLAGHTLNAVAYVSAPPGSHQGGLARLMLQAYLAPGGRALVRIWDEGRDAYTPVAERGWSLEGSTLCVGLPGEPSRVCADVHVWGARIAGMSIKPYVQLNGDLLPGDALGVRR